MKKKFIITGMMLLFAWLFVSCASSAPALNESKSSVWEISKDGKTLFLGGSIHLLREQDLPLPFAFDVKF